MKLIVLGINGKPGALAVQVVKEVFKTDIVTKIESFMVEIHVMDHLQNLEFAMTKPASMSKTTWFMVLWLTIRCIGLWIK